MLITEPMEVKTSRPWSVILVFDGQDFPALHASQATHSLASRLSKNCLLVGIHANENRIYEYGVAAQADYANRGDRASQTTQFVLNELIVYLKSKFPLSSNRADWSIGGFSLSGLMALDIAWNHPDYFSKAGVFSGSFWWRQKALDHGYEDSDRIMHALIRSTKQIPDSSFWFQVGTQDEEDDRDGDGVIDSIADTLDLIAEIERKGYQWGKNVQYLEVKNGVHAPSTWATVFPDFLHWTQEAIE
ncbi:esterase family protein [Arundinibacter roseus]|uniref:Esterase family protein n=2 Tax=Arundinibacter roseus TaxID=2070510 RepID=A0A4R4KGG7_9BACT|nr:esterase family protein [Arundinibacter roseus]